MAAIDQKNLEECVQNAHPISNSRIQEICDYIDAHLVARTHEFHDKLSRTLNKRYGSARHLVRLDGAEVFKTTTDGVTVEFTHHYGFALTISEDRVYFVIRIGELIHPVVPTEVLIFSRERHNNDWNKVLAELVVESFMHFANDTYPKRQKKKGS